MSKFKKNMRVIKSLAGGGFVTSETCKVLRIDADGVWLDNGSGNDPSGPFDEESGDYLGASTPGFHMSVAPKEKQA